MAKFIPFADRCKAKVKKQFVYTGVRRCGESYGGCDRKAGSNGYCWQHQDIAAELAQLRRIDSGNHRG